MPFYDYDCEACGPFTAMRPMAAYADPAECPACGALAPRQMAAPLVGGGPVAAAPAAGASFSHSGGCGCCAPRARKKLSAEAV